MLSRPGPVRLGCVSYLNAKPLIHRLVEDHVGRLTLTLDVPARLLDGLLTDAVDLALCPVIDYFRSPVPLELVPVGGIACAGPTLTVRLFSRIPINTITRVQVDTDSHTSVALLRVLLHEIHGLDPTLHHQDTRAARLPADAEAALLIGDKVVTDAPDDTQFSYQLDLGEAWHRLTGRPFVFATWMKRRGREVGDVPTRLADQLESNLDRLDAIVGIYASAHGWPEDLARRYLGQILTYRIGTADAARSTISADSPPASRR